MSEEIPNMIGSLVDGNKVDAVTGINNIFGIFVEYIATVLFYKIVGFYVIK